MSTRGTPRRSPRPLLFYRLAPLYDALTSGKDTEAEVAYLERLARAHGRSRARSWLDVACGTGRHLELLRRRFDVVGVDLSGPMLRVARKRLPKVRLVRGDMRSFHLGRTFDVVSCLYSAVGHLPSEPELLRAFRNLARHVAPGGVCLIEPWIEPEKFRDGHVSLDHYAGPELTVARVSASARRGPRSVVRYSYLVGRPGAPMGYFEETDVGLLVRRPRLVELLTRAGLRSRYLERGLTPGRGLLLGVKPTVEVGSRR